MKEKGFLIFPLLVLSMFLLFCDNKVISKLDGQWHLVNFENHSNIDMIEIIGDSVTIIDFFGTKFPGVLEKNNFKIRLPDDKTENIDIQYKDSLLTISDSISLNRLEYQSKHLSSINLLDIGTNVEYPLKNIILDNKESEESPFRVRHLKINIKLRNTTNARTLVMGDTEIAISELYNFVQNSVCSGGKPLSYRYDEVAILIEKEVSVEDLLILEQVLAFNNHIRNFILVTECKEIGKYSIIIDKRFYFHYDLIEVPILIDDYLSRKENLIPPMPLPPPLPPQSSRNSIVEHIKSINGEIIKIEGLDDYINKRTSLIRNRKKIVTKLSNKMNINEYIYILRDIQNLRLTGKDIKVHILN